MTIAAGATATISNAGNVKRIYGQGNATVQTFTVYGTLNLADIGGLSASSLPDSYPIDYLPNAGLVLYKDIALKPGATLNATGNNELWSDCCTSPDGLVNEGATVNVDGTFAVQARYDTSGVNNVPSGSTLILAWPAYAGATTYAGGGTVCVCDNGNPGWSDTADSHGNIHGGYVMAGTTSLANGTVFLVADGAAVSGTGNFSGTGVVQLGKSSWYGRSTLGAGVAFRTTPGTRAQISQWTNKPGLIGSLTLGKSASLAAGAWLSTSTDKGLTVPKGVTLTVPNAGAVSSGGCCTGGPNLIVNGTLALGGGPAGHRFEDTTPSTTDPAYLGWVDLGGTGTVTFGGTVEFDNDADHHFTGTFKGSGKIVGDLAIAKATFAPSGDVQVTDDVTMSPGASYVIKVTGTKARPKIANTLKVADQMTMAGTVTTSGLRAAKNKVVTLATFGGNVYGTKFARVTGHWRGVYASRSVKLKAT